MLRDFRRAVTELVRAGQRDGTVPATATPEAVATLLGALGDGLFLHARLDPELDAAAALGALAALLQP